MCEHLAHAWAGGQQIIDNDIVALYENLISDKEPEVKSEAVAKLHELSRYATPTRMMDKLIPHLAVLANNDTSQHVRGSLALSICKVAKGVGRALTITHLIAPITQLMKDQATEVRIELMSHLKTLVEVIGQEEFDHQIIPLLTQLATDKIWRVKQALIHFIPQLAEFLDKQLFKERLEPVILGLLSDSVFQIREETVSLLLTLREVNAEDGPFTQAWLEDCLETKTREFHIHEKFA